MDPALDDLLTTAFTGGASDVFLIEGQRPRVRTDGELVTAHGSALTRAQLATIWRDCAIDPDSGLDGDASLALPPIGRLRVNTYRTLGRLGAVLRPIKQHIPSLAELGLPDEVLTRWMDRRSGLILITGPTGSGKSTTIASCLNWINQHRPFHVITLEDPIEYLFENHRSFFSQREISRDTGDFDLALRAALRQNPDVIFFGEIRDTQSAIAALRAAETGHLVFTTLHGSGVVGVPAALERITRLLETDSVSTSSLLSQQLIGVMAQQLLPRINGGLVAVVEYFSNAAVTRKWIAESRFTELRDHLDRSDTKDACSFLAYLVAAARQNIVDAADARAACGRPQDFDRAMRGIT